MNRCASLGTLPFFNTLTARGLSAYLAVTGRVTCVCREVTRPVAGRRHRRRRVAQHRRRASRAVVVRLDARALVLLLAAPRYWVRAALVLVARAVDQEVHTRRRDVESQRVVAAAAAARRAGVHQVRVREEHAALWDVHAAPARVLGRVCRVERALALLVRPHVAAVDDPGVHVVAQREDSKPDVVSIGC